MAGSDLFYKIGKFFGEIGGQENLYRKNLPPGVADDVPSMSAFKAVPDDEIDPAQRLANSFRRVQGKQQAMSLFCCITMLVVFVVFLFFAE
ncbi:MAG: hypothetical protein GYA24_18240 [Candidatus Lokiarchaeota archaeon]|nr:hypothetical protein [Candidatus Lokiarchaeota archaeon]